MLIENRLTLTAAENPRSPYADIMLSAASEIASLRARVDEVNAVAMSAMTDIGAYAHECGYYSGVLSVIERGLGDPMSLARAARERFEDE